MATAASWLGNSNSNSADYVNAHELSDWFDSTPDENLEQLPWINFLFRFILRSLNAVTNPQFASGEHKLWFHFKLRFIRCLTSFMNVPPISVGVYFCEVRAVLDRLYRQPTKDGNCIINNIVRGNLLFRFRASDMQLKIVNPPLACLLLKTFSETNHVPNVFCEEIQTVMQVSSLQSVRRTDFRLIDSMPWSPFRQSLSVCKTWYFFKCYLLLRSFLACTKVSFTVSLLSLTGILRDLSKKKQHQVAWFLFNCSIQISSWDFAPRSRWNLELICQSFHYITQRRISGLPIIIEHDAHIPRYPTSLRIPQFLDLFL